jgi:hypothetical protein
MWLREECGYYIGRAEMVLQMKMNRLLTLPCLRDLYIVFRGMVENWLPEPTAKDGEVAASTRLVLLAETPW